MHFRAFTVAKLGTVETVEVARQQLLGVLEDGGNYADLWERINQTLDIDPTKLTPRYWETVFRTNTQSAYTAGKLQKYEGTGAVAYQLMVIEDSRTSRICRHLLTQSGYGVALPVGHSFWQKYGFPPYHFNCRTSICPIYSSQVAKPGFIVEDIPMNHFTKFKPQEGFGGNPLDRGNWWMMTPSQMEQAIKYGCLNRFNREENIFADYDKVWKGYTRYNGKNGGWYDLYKNPPDDWETKNRPVVEILVKNGHKIKIIPKIENIKAKYKVKWSNPDIIIDGLLSDIKEPTKPDSSGILSRLNSARKQGLFNAVLMITDTMTETEILKGIKRFEGSDFTSKMNIIWIYKGNINYYKI